MIVTIATKGGATVKRVLVALALVAVLGATWVGVSSASGPVDAQAPNARLAVLIYGGDSTGTFTVMRKKGVAAVTNPATGWFCIKPSSSTMKLGRIVPIVTLDAQGTPNADTTAQWSALNWVCPSGTIEVQSFVVPTRVSRNRVGFALVVI
jgi:hypothetical protein